MGLPSFRRPAWFQGASALTTRWLESTLEMARWENMRKAGRRWGWWGAGVGALIGLVAYAPASWLAQGLVVATGGHLLPASSEGTIWNGNAVAVLTGGPGSRDARALPGRLHWQMRPRWWGVQLTLRQDCCTHVPVVLSIKPGWGQVRAEVALQPSSGGALQTSGAVGQWPAAWLGGLGTPWNTLQIGGALRIATQDLVLQWRNQRVQVQGQLQMTLDHVSSPVTTLDHLGSYKLVLAGGGAPDAPPQLSLSTLEGALQLQGQGELTPSGLRFRGEARASEAEQGALDNLLNIIGRREGDRSVISIG